MSQEVLVQIERLISIAPPFIPQGKTYSVFEYVVSGWIAGDYCDNFVVKTLSKKANSYIDDGLQFNAEVDEYQGKVKYKVPSYTYAEGGIFAQMNHAPKKSKIVAQAPAPHTAPAAPPTPQHAPAPPPPPAGQLPTVYTPPPTLTQPTYKDIVNLHLQCMATANELYADMTETSRTAIAATLFIESNKKAIRAEVIDDNVPFGDAPPVPNAAPPPPATGGKGMNDAMVTNMMTTIIPILAGANLIDRVNSAKGLGALVDATIAGWYVQSQGNDNTFKMTANNELMKLGV